MPDIITEDLLAVEVVLLRKQFVVGADGRVECWRFGIGLTQPVVGEKFVEVGEGVEAGRALEKDLGVGALAVDPCGLPHGESDEKEAGDADDEFCHGSSIARLRHSGFPSQLLSHATVGLAILR